MDYGSERPPNANANHSSNEHNSNPRYTRILPKRLHPKRAIHSLATSEAHKHITVYTLLSSDALQRY
mgnify:CR=1 FL=1